MLRATAAKLLVIPVFFLLIASSWAGVNDRASEFKLRDLKGNEVTLSDYRGRVVFIDFWASWCAPCKKEFPELSGFSRRYKPSAVAFLAINVDKKPEHAKDFLSRVSNLSDNVTVLLDTDSSVISKYNVMAMPTSFIIDKEGVIRNIHFGYREEDPKSWAEEIDRLIK